MWCGAMPRDLVFGSSDHFVAAAKVALALSGGIDAIRAVSNAQVCCSKAATLNATVEAVAEAFHAALEDFAASARLLLVPTAHDAPPSRQLRAFQRQVSPR